MSDTEIASTPGPALPQRDTFCAYFAKQLVAKKGYTPDVVPEAAELAANCDIVLSLYDGFALTIACLVDREANPGKTFGLSSDTVESIGQACLKYTSRVGTRKMPVSIQIYEIGWTPADESQRQRLQPFSSGLTAKVQLSAWSVDARSGKIWTTANFGLRWRQQRFIENLRRSPWESDEALSVPAVAAVLRPSFPWLTCVMLAVLVGIFAAELRLGVDDWTKFFQPSLLTLEALGGLTRGSVLQSGEWYRLLSAPLLHADAAHLAMNGIALFLAGRAIEGLIGRAWFAVIFIVAALCGALGSLTFNSPTLISVGASGGVTGLFAAMLILSLHFRSGPSRTALQMSAVYVLIPSLLPLASARGANIDYAAHFGGALGGAAVALLLLAIWPREAVRPRFQSFAIGVAVAGLALFAYPAVPLAEAYPAMQLRAALIPPAKLPRTKVDAQAQSAALVQAYPRDPRAHMVRSHVLWEAKDLAGVERELRAALAEENLWRKWFPADLSVDIRMLLAAALMPSRPEEAKDVARPICGVATGPAKQFLNQMKVCDN